MRTICRVAAVLLIVGGGSGFGQPASPMVADVHASPARSYSPFFAVLLPNDRYVARNATMIDLIATAYGLDAASIQGGPSWLERDHFDIVARLRADASKDEQQTMLQALLGERFHLEMATAVRPMPAYLLSASKGAETKLKPTDGLGEAGCTTAQKSTPSINVTMLCHGISVDELARQLPDEAGAYVDQPVVNSTGLVGKYDFNLQWTERRRDLLEAGAISVFDALDRQLGLKLAVGTAPRPVAFVSSVLRLPTPNAADLDKLLPPLPAPQFEVATVKLSRPDAESDSHVTREGIDFRGLTMKDLVGFAWDLDERNPAVFNMPRGLDQVRFDVVGKVAMGMRGRAVAGEGNLPIDFPALQEMARTLLMERFQMKVHMEDRPLDAYELVAAGPKLKAADPKGRAGCNEGPGPDGKDPRLQNPILYRLTSCRNTTMAEFAQQLPRISNGYISEPVFDATGLNGAYDFTLSFTGANRYQRGVARSTDEMSDPSGALSLFDAVSRQLGLKLVKRRRLLPGLVIDHIEEMPAEN